jgi:hypothetical protein
MALMAADLVHEYNLTGSWITKMVGLYQKYYSNIAQVYANIAKMKATMGDTTSGKMISGGTGSAPIGSEDRVYAEGGSLIANRPTTVTFGEAGLEMASFIPLNRVGKNVNQTFSNISGGASSGKVSIELLLSPDLESRVVSNTLNGVAEVFTRVQKTR